MQAELKQLHTNRIEIGKTNPAARSTVGLEDLVASVREKVVLQPLIVRPPGKDRYELVCGHRRLAAAKQCEMLVVPALVRELSDAEALEIQLVENLQRRDLHPLEEAEGYAKLERTPGYDVAT